MKKTLLASAVGLGFALACSAASADVTFLTGNHPQSQEQEVLFKTDQTGGVITGITNHSSTLVDFTSTTGQTLQTSSKGQAKINLDGGGFITGLSVDVPGETFQDLIVNLDDLQSDVTITAHLVGEPDQTHTFAFNPDHGENFFTIFATNDELISSVSLSSTVGFLEFQQPRVSGISGVVLVPEPSTWAMMILGFVGLGYAGYRRGNGARAALT
jgi:ABC-type amino acid transport substrate-binding protein